MGCWKAEPMAPPAKLSAPNFTSPRHRTAQSLFVSSRCQRQVVRAFDRLAQVRRGKESRSNKKNKETQYEETSSCSNCSSPQHAQRRADTADQENQHSTGSSRSIGSRKRCTSRTPQSPCDHDLLV